MTNKIITVGGTSVRDIAAGGDRFEIAVAESAFGGAMHLLERAREEIDERAVSPTERRANRMSAMRDGLKKFGLEDMLVTIFAQQRRGYDAKRELFPLNEGREISLVEACLRRAELLAEIGFVTLFQGSGVPYGTTDGKKVPCLQKLQAIAIFRGEEEIGSIPWNHFHYEAAPDIRTLLIWWFITSSLSCRDELRMGESYEAMVKTVTLCLRQAPWDQDDGEGEYRQNPLVDYFRYIWFLVLERMTRYLYGDGHDQAHLPVAGMLWKTGSRLIGKPHKGFTYMY